MTTAADGGVTQTYGTGLVVAHLDTIVSEQRLDEGLGGVFAGVQRQAAAWCGSSVPPAHGTHYVFHWAFRRAGSTYSCRPRTPCR